MYSQTCPSFSFDGDTAVGHESDAMLFDDADGFHGVDDGGGGGDSAMHDYDHDGADTQYTYRSSNGGLQYFQPPLPTTPPRRAISPPPKKQARAPRPVVDRVKIFPRNRAGGPAAKSTAKHAIPVIVTLEEVLKFQGIKSVKELAIYYGLSRTSVKSCLRKLGLPTWN